MNLLNEKNEDWIIGKLSEWKLSYIKRNKGYESKVICYKFAITNAQDRICPDIFTSGEDVQALEINMEKIIDSTLNLKANIGNLYVTFCSSVIQKILLFVHDLFSLDIPLKANQNLTKEIINIHANCTENSNPIVSLSVSIKNAYLICLHDKYLSPFCKLEISSPSFNYQKYIDHTLTYGNYNEIVLADMTRYPNTINPSEIKLEKQCDLYNESIFPSTKFASLKSIGSCSSFELKRFGKQCPKRPNKIPNTDCSIKLFFSQIWITYIDELTFKRELEYILGPLLSTLFISQYMYILLLL